MQVEYSHDFCIVHGETDILKQWEDDLIALNGFYRPQTKAGRAGYYFLAQESAQIGDFVKDANAGTIQPKQIAQNTPVSRPHIKRRVNYLDYEIQAKDEVKTPEITKPQVKSCGVRVITVSQQRPAHYIPAPLMQSPLIPSSKPVSKPALPKALPKAAPKTASPVRTITITHARPANHIPSAYVAPKPATKPATSTTTTTTTAEPLNPPALREFINSKSDVVELLNAYGDHPRVKELLQRLMALSV